MEDKQEAFDQPKSPLDILLGELLRTLRSSIPICTNSGRPTRICVKVFVSATFTHPGLVLPRKSLGNSPYIIYQ